MVAFSGLSRREEAAGKQRRQKHITFQKAHGIQMWTTGGAESGLLRIAFDTSDFSLSTDVTNCPGSTLPHHRAHPTTKAFDGRRDICAVTSASIPSFSWRVSSGLTGRNRQSIPLRQHTTGRSLCRKLQGCFRFTYGNP